MNYRHVLKMIDEMRMANQDCLNGAKLKTRSPLHMTTKELNEKHRLLFSKCLETAVVFDIQNIHEYVIDKVSPRHEAVMADKETFPNFRLPYPNIWMEYACKIPSYDGENAIREIESVGVLCVNFPVGDCIAIQMVVYLKIKRLGLFGPFGAMLIKTDKDGGITNSGMLDMMAKSSYAGGGEGKFLTRSKPDDLPMIHDIGLFVSSCMYAVQFMNCKNVAQDTKEPPTTINERHRRNHPPLVTYKMLRIGTMPAARATGGAAASQTDIIPYHICRGHFKHFTAEKPLLGKFVGTYWWEAHARGSKKHGEVIKDYQLERTVDHEAEGSVAGVQSGDAGDEGDHKA